MPKLTVSPAALSYFTSYLADKQTHAILFTIKKMGCNGYAHILEPITEAQIPTDAERFDFDTLCIVMPTEAQAVLDGTHIDYLHSGFESRIIFYNPQAKGECGCGESFNV